MDNNFNNDDGYSIAELIDAQTRSTASNKTVATTTKINDAFSKIDLKALGKSIKPGSSLSNKETRISKTFDTSIQESRVKTIDIPTGFDPLAKQTGVNSVDINPTYIDIDVPRNSNGDVQILNPNNPLKSQVGDVIIIHDETTIAEFESKESGGMGYEKANNIFKIFGGGGIATSRTTQSQDTAPMEDFIILESAPRGIQKLDGLDIQLAENNDNISSCSEGHNDGLEESENTDSNDIFNTGSSIEQVAVPNFNDTVTDDEFDLLTNSIQNAADAINKVRQTLPNFNLT